MLNNPQQLIADLIKVLQYNLNDFILDCYENENPSYTKQNIDDYFLKNCLNPLEEFKNKISNIYSKEKSNG